MSKPETTYSLQTAIELACAAMRANNGYIKENEVVFSTDPSKHCNKELIQVAIGAINPQKYENLPHKPVLLCTNLNDRELANDIQKYFKRLLFTAINGEDQFKTDLFTVLSKSEVPSNKFGFIAYLPVAYQRDKYDSAIKKVEEGYLGPVGAELLDLDCEVIRSSRSKNYDAWNIDAIINNKLVSWMAKQEVKLGPCVLIKGKVKDHSKHWKFPIDVTRLNYVKAFQ